MAKSCKGCVYWRSLTTKNKSIYMACHYLLETGEQRGCSAVNCNKYTYDDGRKKDGKPGAKAKQG